MRIGGVTVRSTKPACRPAWVCSSTASGRRAASGPRSEPEASKTPRTREPSLHNQVLLLHELYLKLRERRELRGALDIDSVEPKFVFNAARKIERIETRERNDAHRLIEELRNTTPILLLDDVFSELDHDRASRVLSLIPAGQVFVTTAREDEVPISGRRWAVREGTIT